MNYWHPWQLKKIKVLGALLKYQLNSNANSAHLSCLAGSSKWTPRILIFSIVMGADKLLYVKAIAIYAPTFLGIYSVLAIVACTQRFCKLAKSRVHKTLA